MSMWWQCQPLHCTRMGFRPNSLLLRSISSLPSISSHGKSSIKAVMGMLL